MPVPDTTLLAVFIPTFILVAITPGMCMTLAMTLGMTIGVRRTLWMMLGEIIGVAIVAVSAVIGVATLMLQYPHVFAWFKWIGAAYLLFIGVKMFLSQNQGNHTNNAAIQISNQSLFNQGLVTAIANPKSWAFMISLLPPFINVNQAIAPQLTLLVIIILATEFSSMLLYASGGKTLKHFLARGDNSRWLNRIAGSLMIIIGCWLAIS